MAKGQSALEYLMTYGWALIVIVVIIAALFLLIGNPTSGTSTCTVGGKLQYSTQNLVGTDYNIVLINGTGINLQEGSYSVTVNGINATATGAWNAGTAKLFSASGVTRGPNNQITVTASYTDAAGTHTETKICTLQ
ncbi:MAG: hypothetical protein N3D73_01940 [Candidatus Diapherotrites archaeon]|nr:hypothetical protein [Candidatus Diapherotrites archaeon]